MRRVAQRVGNDCGIAAVATIADVTYEEAKAAFGPFPGRGYGTDATDVRKALGRLGVRLGKNLWKTKRSKPLDLPFHGLILVTLARGSDAWFDH